MIYIWDVYHMYDRERNTTDFLNRLENKLVKFLPYNYLVYDFIFSSGIFLIATIWYVPFKISNLG